MSDGVLLRSPRQGVLLRTPRAGALVRTARVGTLLRGQRGPAGVASEQDLMLGLSGGPFGAGVILDGGLFEGAGAYARVKFFSRTGVSGPAEFVIRINDAPAGAFTVASGSLPLRQSFDVSVPFAEDDQLSLAVPSDPQLADFVVTFGSAA